MGPADGRVDLPAASADVTTDSKILLVDFDVAQSFGQQAGASVSWVMHPVMTATDLELSGTVDVSLALAQGVTLPTGVTLDGFSAVLTNAAGSAKTLPLAAGADGAFTAQFLYLIPGSYTLSFTAPAGVTSFTTSPPTAPPAAVSVASGQPTAAAYQLSAVQ